MWHRRKEVGDDVNIGHYGLALDAQLDLLRRWDSEEGHHWSKEVRTTLLSTSGAAPSALDIIRSMQHELLYAEPFYVSEDISRLIDVGAESMPNWILAKEAIGFTNGFAWFASPVSLPTNSLIDDTVQSGSLIRAMSWELMVSREAKTQKGFPSSDVHGVSVTWYIEARGKAAYPASTAFWPFGDGLEDWAPLGGLETASPKAKAFHPVFDRLQRVFASFIVFIGQQFIAVEKHTPERHLRKRATAAGKPETTILRVIVLRAATGSDSTEKGEADIEWSCRWLVRGHWRMQWYPSRAVHMPIWITPYVKGPDNKPLRPPRTDLFAVVR